MEGTRMTTGSMALSGGSVARSAGERMLYSSILIAAIVSIVIGGIAGFAAYSMKGSTETYCSAYSPLSFVLTLVGGNWTLTSTCSNRDMDLSAVDMTVRDQFNVISGSMNAVPLSNLTKDNWQAHGAMYEKVGTESYVRVGAKIIVDAARYPVGSRYSLVNSYTIVATGVFR